MANEDFFVALTECHFMNPQTMSEIDYYPNVQRWWGSVGARAAVSYAR